MVRVFIGIAIPEDIKRYVSDIQEKLQSLPITAKFVEYENLHISLSFLGDVENSEVVKIESKLDEIAKLYDIFSVVIGNVLLIPNEKYTRVIALSVESENLEFFRKGIVETIGGSSHHPHLTLARVKNIDGKRKFVEEVNKVVCKEMAFKIGDVCLFESILQKSGPVYKILHTSYLK